MVLIRLGDFLYRAGWVISGLLLFDFPATIFAYSGFFPRMTNVADTIAVGFACTAVGCLSWFAGRALRYVLARIKLDHLVGAEVLFERDETAYRPLQRSRQWFQN
jgi:hypothetical protein